MVNMKRSQRSIEDKVDSSEKRNKYLWILSNGR